MSEEKELHPMYVHDKRRSSDGAQYKAMKNSMSEETLEKVNDYRADFNKKTYRPYIVRFNKTRDAEIVSKLDSLDNVTDYIRTLIKKDLGI